MDTQLTKMRSRNKNKNEIIYTHNGETVIIRRNTDDDNKVFFTEIRINTVTGKKKTRFMESCEMTEDQFQNTKSLLDKELLTATRREWQETHLNVCFDALEETDLASIPSPETEMIEEIEKQERDDAEAKNPLRRTKKNGLLILQEILNEKQIDFFIEYHQNKLSARKIAEKYGVAHTTVSRALKVIDKKIEKYLLTH